MTLKIPLEVGLRRVENLGRRELFKLHASSILSWVPPTPQLHCKQDCPYKATFRFWNRKYGPKKPALLSTTPRRGYYHLKLKPTSNGHKILVTRDIGVNATYPCPHPRARGLYSITAIATVPTPQARGLCRITAITTGFIHLYIPKKSTVQRNNEVIFFLSDFIRSSFAIFFQIVFKFMTRFVV